MQDKPFAPDLRREFAQYLLWRREHEKSAEVLAHLVRVGFRDNETTEALGEALFHAGHRKFPLGSIERGKFLLWALGRAFPSRTLEAAYFENLEHLLRARTRRRVGRLVLGVGCGRCGSTTLTGIVAGLAGTCATHENPPHIFWRPQRRQVEFHLRRFSMLLPYFDVVFDAAHWWMPVLDQVLARFPSLKIVGLYRDTEACVRSFEQKAAREKINHWAPSGNTLWSGNVWDDTFPSYLLPADAEQHAKEVRRNSIRRYVEEYNALLHTLPRHLGNSATLVQTETLSDEVTQYRLFGFLGISGRAVATRLNANSSTTDGNMACFRF